MKTAGLFISLLSSLALSSLIHMVDPDVNGIQGLLNLHVVISVVIYAMLPFLLMIMIQFVYIAMGKYYGLLSLFLLAGISAFGLNLLMGSISWESFFGGLLIFSLTFLIGAIFPAYFFRGENYS